MKKLQLLIICVLFTFKTFGQQTLYGASGSDVMVPNWPIAECFGTTQNLHDFLDQGKVVIVYYADTWCGICKDKVKREFTSAIIKDWKAKYPNKIEFLAAFDGPTDCNGVRNAKNDYGWGSEIKGFIDNGDNKSKFFTWGAPGFSIIDPKTKKLIYSTYNNSEPGNGLKALGEILNGTYKLLDASVNLAYRKPLTDLVPNNENPFEPILCVNDGIAGTTFQARDGWRGTGFVIDFQGQANVTGFNTYFQEGFVAESFTVAIGNSPTGPWENISGNFGRNKMTSISNINKTGRYIKWESPGKGILSEFTVQGNMQPTALDDLNITDAEASFKVFPNPADEELIVEMTMAKSSAVKISIINSLGQEVMQIQNGMTSHISTNVNTSELVPGIYIITSQIGSSQLKPRTITIR